MIQRSIAGFRLLAGGRLLRALALFLALWLCMFVGIASLSWHTMWRVHEHLVRGDLSPTLPPNGQCVFVTLVTGNSYVRGARVLGHTLRMRSSVDAPLIALTVGLDTGAQQRLRAVGWEVRAVAPLPFRPPGAPASWRWLPETKLGRAHINALTKMRVWQLQGAARAVFVDADAWVVGDIADLCRRTEDIVAWGEGDINSGVMSLRPNASLFDDFMSFWRDEPEKLEVYHRGNNVLANPDQSLIVGFARHHKWLRLGPLSEKYNLNGRQEVWADVRIVHFNVDAVKPWSVTLQRAREYRATTEAQGDKLSSRVWRLVESWNELEAVVNATYATPVSQ